LNLDPSYYALFELLSAYQDQHDPWNDCTASMADVFDVVGLVAQFGGHRKLFTFNF
jgi:hypothetical protein